jgi:hypothetical protein
MPLEDAAAAGAGPGTLLAVAAALFFTGVSPDTIRKGLGSYNPSEK